MSVWTGVGQNGLIGGKDLTDPRRREGAETSPTVETDLKEGPDGRVTGRIS